MALKRALTLQNVMGAEVRKFPFTGDGARHSARRRRRVWYIFGGSGSGKTSFVLMLMKPSPRSQRYCSLVSRRAR